MGKLRQTTAEIQAILDKVEKGNISTPDWNASENEEGYIKNEDIARLIAFRNNPSDESWIK